MAIEWDRIGQPGFDRIVEALVHRMYDASALVEVVNGRGGDDGIDIKVTHQSRVRIFQLKYYLDGFPTAAAFSGLEASHPSSLVKASRTAPAWERPVGSWSAHLPGCTSSNACGSATRCAQTSTWVPSNSPAASSA
jgi:hypothetical protein